MPVVHDQLQICFLEAWQSEHNNSLTAITRVMQRITNKEVQVKLDDILEDFIAVTGLYRCTWQEGQTTSCQLVPSQRRTPGLEPSTAALAC